MEWGIPYINAKQLMKKDLEIPEVYLHDIIISCVTFGNIWVVLNYMLLNQNILLMLIKPDFLGWCWNFMVVILSLK